MTEKTEIFLSYNRKDSKWVDRLLGVLDPLLKGKNVSLWSDSQIFPGDDWREAIESSLDRSKLAILLISADYLASKFLVRELSLVIEREKKGMLRILPVIVSPIVLTPSSLDSALQNYQFINSLSEPLGTVPKSKQDEIFAKLYQEVEKSLPRSASTTEDEVYPLEDKYSIALKAAIGTIGGAVTVGSINILGGHNIFIEAEERLARRDDK